MRHVLDQDLQERLVAVLDRHPEVSLALVFGSFSKGTQRPDSDLDLAIFAGSALSVDKRLELTSELSIAVGREVDLVDAASVQGTILQEILTQGIVVVRKDMEAYERLVKKMLYDEADFMPLYRRLLKERREAFLAKQPGALP